MNEKVRNTHEALEAVRLAKASLDYKTKPTFTRETIDEVRTKTEAGLALAIELLEGLLTEGN
jgi:hypothetical protein